MGFWKRPPTSGTVYKIQYSSEPVFVTYKCLRAGCGAEMRAPGGDSSGIELLLQLRDIHEEVAHGHERRSGEPQAGSEYYLG